MPFHFKRKEKVAKAVRRLCRERLDAALKDLRHGDRAESVHGVRKKIKKLRAVLRLVRKGVGGKRYRKSNHLLREAADHLTGIRDAHVRLSAFDKLTKHFAADLRENPFPKIKEALQQNSRKEESDFEESDSTAKVKEILCRLKRQMKKLEWKKSDWSVVVAGLENSFCRGREALNEIRKNPSPEHFHEWRKRIKDLWYDLRLLCPAWLAPLQSAANELASLSELLGDDHDLVMLAEFVATRKFPAAEKKKLNELIALRQKELRGLAVKAGTKFYAEEPEHFCRRFGDHWKSWRAN